MKLIIYTLAIVVGALLGSIPNKPVEAQVQGSGNGLATVASTTAETCHQMKVGQGLVYSVGASAGASALFIFVVDTATTPANGTVIPIIPTPQVAINGQTFLTFPTPIRFGSGLFVCGSTTGQFAFAGSATGQYSAQVQ